MTCKATRMSKLTRTINHAGHGATPFSAGRLIRITLRFLHQPSDEVTDFAACCGFGRGDDEVFARQPVR